METTSTVAEPEEELTDQETEATEVEATEAETEANDQAVEEPSTYTKLEQQHYQQIREEERKVTNLKFTWDSAKEEASACKKRFDTADELLRDLIHSDPSQMQLPGMDGPEDTAATEDESSQEPWRSVPLEETGIPLASCQKMAEGKVTTLGQLAEFTVKNELTDFLGIGPVAAAEAEEALEAFWREHPELAKSEEPEEEVEDEGEEDEGEEDEGEETLGVFDESEEEPAGA